MFCPKCSRQYLEGEQECTECKVSLTEKAEKKSIRKTRFLQCFLLSLICFLIFVGCMEFFTADATIFLCFIFGFLVFAFFLDNDWGNLFVLPLAWLLVILYALPFCCFFCTGDIGWIALGGQIEFMVGLFFLIVPNIIYSLLLAVIHWGIRKKRIKNNLEREG
ncbi:MAG: hypothetical protein ACOX2N_05705 [Peptococcia bacterium]